MSDESRIIQLNNGLSPRQKRIVGGYNVTVAEVNQAFKDERVETEKMVKWYMRQVPEFCANLVTKMFAEMCEANGLTFKGPEATPEASAVSENAGGDPATPDTNAP